MLLIITKNCGRYDTPFRVIITPTAGIHTLNQIMPKCTVFENHKVFEKSPLKRLIYC